MSLNFYFKNAAKLCAWVPPGDAIISGIDRKLSEFSEEAHGRPFHLTHVAAYRQILGDNYRVYAREVSHFDYQGGMVAERQVYLGTLSAEQCRGLQGFDTRQVQAEAYRLLDKIPRDQWQNPKGRQEIYFQALIRHVRRAQQLRQLMR